MKQLSILTLILITLHISGYCQSPDKSITNTADTIQKTYVQISARNLSLEAVDSYPQKLLKVIRNEDTIKTVLISTFSEYEEPDRVTRVKNAPYNPTFKYPSAISRFLEPTQYVNSSSKSTASVADTLFNGKEKYCLDIIKKALAFSKRITFDTQLAQALDRGQSMTVPSDEVLQSMTGTCSEATNVFLALMRHMGIPARMVVGYCYLPQKGINNSHAWAECYIEGVGWWGVDPQNGSPAISYIGYKLFYGKDFKDCRIKRLPDMYLRDKQSVKITTVTL